MSVNARRYAPVMPQILAWITIGCSPATAPPPRRERNRCENVLQNVMCRQRPPHLDSIVNARSRSHCDIRPSPGFARKSRAQRALDAAAKMTLAGSVHLYFVCGIIDVRSHA